MTINLPLGGPTGGGGEGAIVTTGTELVELSAALATVLMEPELLRVEPFNVEPVEVVPRGVVGGVSFAINSSPAVSVPRIGTTATVRRPEKALGFSSGQPVENRVRFLVISYPIRSGSG